MHLIKLSAGIGVIQDFLSVAECQHHIAFSKSLGFEEAPIQTQHGAIRFTSIRNNDRVMFDDSHLATTLFERARPFLPPTFENRYLQGFNERFRVYRYHVHQFFKWHKDGSFIRNEQEHSELSFLMYLNADFSGGETAFEQQIIVPELGMACFFPHHLRHQGASVTAGIKYMLRTDVMYQNNPH